MRPGSSGGDVLTVGGRTVKTLQRTTLDLAGTSVAGDASDKRPGVSGYRMLGVVVEGAGGPWFVEIRGPLGSHCAPKDGWKSNAAGTAQAYKNKGGQIPSTCALGSALGIGAAKAVDKTTSLKGALVNVGGKNGTYGPASGLLKVVAVLGGAAESAVGQCGELTLLPAQCALAGATFKCKSH